MTNSAQLKQTPLALLALFFVILFLNTFKMSPLRKAKLMAPDPELLCPSFCQCLYTSDKRGLADFLPISSLTCVKPVQKGNTVEQKKRHVPALQQCSLHKIASFNNITIFSNYLPALKLKWLSRKPLNF